MMEWLTFAVGLLLGMGIGAMAKSYDRSSAVLNMLGKEMENLADRQSGYVSMSLEFGKVKADDDGGDGNSIPDDPSESWRNN